MSDSLRRWSLTAADPFSGVIAADARISKTDYHNDQIWELRLGQADSTALSLNTRFGGRIGLVSIAPLWTYEGRSIYAASGYVKPPVITRFAPGLIRAEAQLLPFISSISEFLIVDSHTVVGRFLLANYGHIPVELQLDLVVFAANEEGELTPKRLTPPNYPLALGIPLDGLQPAIVMEGAQLDDFGARKLTCKITVPPSDKTAVQWSCAGYTHYPESIAAASQAVRTNIVTQVKHLLQIAPEIPFIETGDTAVDAAISASYQQTIQSFLNPTSSLPHPSFVSTRQPERGADSVRSWSGQNPTHAYLVALAAAPVNPALAQGILLNYLAVQRADGWIDWKPGLDGQRQGMLCLPILAQLAWKIFEYTEDRAFLEQAYLPLVKFFERWLQPDLDADGDGIPEWQSEVQTGYPYSAAFAVGRSWGQNADIRAIESPDLIAYLLSEAASLRQTAHFLNDSDGENRCQGHIARLAGLLETFWQDGRYHYRDRDLDISLSGSVVLEDVRGGEDLSVGLEIKPVNRLIVSIHGGAERQPKFTLRMSGKDAQGSPIQETADSKAFIWTHSRGVYTSNHAWSRLDTIATQGLTTGFKVRLATLDTTAYDISALIPFSTPDLQAERTAELARAVQADFMRANGVTMAAKTEPLFDPANARGPGGIWLFWNTLIGEALIDTGMTTEASELLQRLLKVQTETLRAEKHFFEFYHTDQPRGLGERGSVAGLIPLHLLLRVFGVRVISPSVVIAGGAFHWPSPIKIAHHNVFVERNQQGTQINFPTGHVHRLSPDAPLTRITDPRAKSATP
ncbi:MAG: hypothetical protein IAE89_02610 [Anaerolineae bacterium]|nr:hypothetical protein [Anaerolineae bacterium]